MPAPRPSRRQVLTWAGAGAAWLLLPGCGDKTANTPPPVAAPRFLTEDERSMLSGLADMVVPNTDGLASASQLGVADYVDRLLTAFDPGVAAPPLMVSGPNSKRNAVPDADGNATAQAGDDDFANPLALDRVQLASWKLFLYGSDAVGGFPNDAVLGKVIGLRDRMRTGLAQAVAVNASVPPAQLNAAQQAAAFHALDADFRDLVVELTLQALWSAPEYGGNTALGGWTLVHYEGDVEPFGYTQWDASSQSMRERADHPVSTANPGADPDPLDDEVRQLVTTAVQLLGGRVAE